MGTIYIKNKLCPFCRKTLRNNSISVPNNGIIPLLECQECHAYFYKQIWYNKLKKIAGENHRRLNRDVYIYQEIQPKVVTKRKKIKTKRKASAPTHEKIANNKTIRELPIEQVDTDHRNNDVSGVKQCKYYRNKYCIYMDDTCKPYSVRCNKKIRRKPKTETEYKQDNDNVNNVNTERHFVTAIVLSDNRKCTKNNHLMKNVVAYCKVAAKNGFTIEVQFPAAYCQTCRQYFVLKKDYLSVKAKGALLCQVEDRTSKYLSKHGFIGYGNESKIHMLGYNVMSKYDYTYEQRKMILANIIENTEITKQEILSVIDANIARHQSRINYDKAVSKWMKDREFVSNYKLGDYPEVIISKFIIGR